jgi:YHS domain-containing protein
MVFFRLQHSKTVFDMWKNIVFFGLLAFVSPSLFGQQTANTTSKGYAVDGYDVVAYFEKRAQKGTKKFETTFEGVHYRFVSKENLEKFQERPQEYCPQYGGWCAYALGAKNKKVSIDPETFEIRDGKLYLFYNSWGINTYKSWKKEGLDRLRAKADENWKALP